VFAPSFAPSFALPAAAPAPAPKRFDAQQVSALEAEFMKCRAPTAPELDRIAGALLAPDARSRVLIIFHVRGSC
jgi:hypothetical protein